MNKDIFALQQYYPRIYLACHTEHKRAKSSDAGLSMRDASILAHLSADEFISPTRLARHMNITKGTLSEALAKLIGLGYVTAEVDDDDGRRQNLKLTEKGVRALSESSVLDYDKIEKLLGYLNGDQRRRAIDGLALLAMAAENMYE
jgi:DNA-binding MarR family transcriptional regulator